MSIKVGVTRQRLIAGAALFIVATAIMAIAGVNMRWYIEGVVIGAAIVVLLTWLGFWRNRDRKP